MKELTGGDKIQCRDLYKGAVEFKPQFKLILTCNDLPKIRSSDGGTWRRLRVVEFTSKFVDDPKESNEFKRDENLSQKMENWKETFMGILIEHYYMYANNGLKEPKEVLKYTEEYRKSNDVFGEFIEENICSGEPGIFIRD